MAVEAKKSATITGLDGAPYEPADVQASHVRTRLSTESVNIGDDDDDGSTYRICRIRSSDVVKSIQLFSDGVSTATGNIGLYDTEGKGGAVVDATLYASAVALTATGSLEVMFEAATVNYTRINTPVWEWLGLSKDPGRDYDITITLVGNVGTGGEVGLRVYYAAGD